jgi:RimJ/RimL family protein N-acetyltransferase
MADPDPPDVPVLPAEGYVLRRWETADLPVLREAAEDPYIPLITTVPPVYTDAAGTAFLERQWGQPATGRYTFAVARGGDGGAVGQMGLRIIDADRAAVGYWIAPSARRAGAAGAALRAVTAWGLGELVIARLELYAEPWNTGSRRTALSAGYACEGLLRDWQRVGGELRDMLMFSALRRPR